MKIIQIIFLGALLQSCSIMLPEMEEVADEALFEEAEIVIDDVQREINILKNH
jgi:hypothetical protein